MIVYSDLLTKKDPTTTTTTTTKLQEKETNKQTNKQIINTDNRNNESDLQGFQQGSKICLSCDQRVHHPGVVSSYRYWFVYSRNLWQNTPLKVMHQ